MKKGNYILTLHGEVTTNGDPYRQPDEVRHITRHLFQKTHNKVTADLKENNGNHKTQ